MTPQRCPFERSRARQCATKTEPTGRQELRLPICVHKDGCEANGAQAPGKPAIPTGQGPHERQSHDAVAALPAQRAAAPPTPRV